ncbi:MAG: hypothetical protein PUK67_06520 [Prevotellaceae bacterium]|nr:hypothetical protein [Prevotellaceae bacterium]MDY3364740.1 hypothetical protein [Prevotella sp.]
MESDMVKDNPEVSMAFIDELFRTMLPQFKKIGSCNMGLYFYAQTYKYNEIKVSLGCERGFLNSELIIQNKNVILDLPEEKKTLQPNKENFYFVFDLLAKYIMSYKNK